MEERYPIGETDTVTLAVLRHNREAEGYRRWSVAFGLLGGEATVHVPGHYPGVLAGRLRAADIAFAPGARRDRLRLVDVKTRSLGEPVVCAWVPRVLTSIEDGEEIVDEASGQERHVERHDAAKPRRRQQERQQAFARFVVQVVEQPGEDGDVGIELFDVAPFERLFSKFDHFAGPALSGALHRSLPRRVERAAIGVEPDVAGETRQVLEGDAGTAADVDDGVRPLDAKRRQHRTHVDAAHDERAHEVVDERDSDDRVSDGHERTIAEALSNECPGRRRPADSVI